MREKSSFRNEDDTQIDEKKGLSFLILMTTDEGEVQNIRRKERLKDVMSKWKYAKQGHKCLFSLWLQRDSPLMLCKNWWLIWLSRLDWLSSEKANNSEGQSKQPSLKWLQNSSFSKCLFWRRRVKTEVVVTKGSTGRWWWWWFLDDDGGRRWRRSWWLFTTERIEMEEKSKKQRKTHTERLRNTLRLKSLHQKHVSWRTNDLFDCCWHLSKEE